MVEPIAEAALSTVTIKALERTTATLIDTIPFKSARAKYEAIKLVLKKGLPDYLAANYAKCETLKTLLNRNDPIALADCFVAPDFALQDQLLSSGQFLSRVKECCDKVVITGLAGCGKSVFLKYSFRQVIQQGYSCYPVFFELRTLNNQRVTDDFLISAIFRSIHSCCDSFTRSQFNHGLARGAFYFLLDGFDELKQDIREQVSSEINGLARNHHKCAVVVTSRPSNEFVSWEGFSEARLQPFDLEKAVDYISKLRFDEDRKSDFLDALQGGLFESNKDFLSNPLLCAMMLLTYDSFGEIPEKRHTFYSKCFDVLVREHDASKGRYVRELFSSLATDELENVFMMFCALSYAENQFSFSEEQMRNYVDGAVSACGIDADIKSVIRDFRESISIMELVGLRYEFTHRSFQEYFYAKFVVTDRKLTLQSKIDRVMTKMLSDDTIEMIADMDAAYFEDDFLLPNIKALDKKFTKINPDVNPASVLGKFFSLVHVVAPRDSREERNAVATAWRHANLENYYFFRQAYEKYRESAPSQAEENSQEKHEKETRIFRDEFGGELKIHHTNNARLVKIGANRFARSIKRGISLLRQELEARQAKRNRGLGALIRKEYAPGR